MCGIFNLIIKVFFLLQQPIRHEKDLDYVETKIIDIPICMLVVTFKHLRN